MKDKRQGKVSRKICDRVLKYNVDKPNFKENLEQLQLPVDVYENIAQQIYFDNPVFREGLPAPLAGFNHQDESGRAFHTEGEDFWWRDE